MLQNHDLWSYKSSTSFEVIKSRPLLKLHNLDLVRNYKISTSVEVTESRPPSKLHNLNLVRSCIILTFFEATKFRPPSMLQNLYLLRSYKISTNGRKVTSDKIDFLLDTFGSLVPTHTLRLNTGAGAGREPGHRERHMIFERVSMCARPLLIPRGPRTTHTLHHR